MIPNQPDHFETLLNQVLHETANPALPQHLESRLIHALRTQNGAPMHTALYAPNTILFTGAQPSATRSFRGFFGAAFVHIAAILLLAVLLLNKTHLIAPAAPVSIALLGSPPPPVKAPSKALAMGGGGGQPGPTPVTRGNPPKFSALRLNPPKAPPLAEPKVNIPVTVDVQPDLQMAHSALPQIGVANSPLVGLSMGNGHGNGLGAGEGAGIGVGAGGNLGGGVMRIGGGVSAPIPTYQPEPEFSEEARRAKVAGNVLVYLQVDELGHPQNVRVLRGIGLGLDEKALEAVRQYRFKPAMKNGHPVRVEMNVDVTFQIF